MVTLLYRVSGPIKFEHKDILDFIDINFGYQNTYAHIL